MAGIRFAGPWRMRLQSYMALSRIAMATYARHALGRKMAPDWDAMFEIGIRFWRHQFTRAMRAGDIAEGRLIFDSLQTETPDVYEVDVRPEAQPRGDWYLPRQVKSGAVLLYLHGGGYTFHAATNRRFAAMLAHHIGARLFAPDYRLTPEHPHPAQAEDALAAWRHVAGDGPVVVIGDSAGGHMALRLLLDLREAGLGQPALCIGLCPWTDIGARGESLYGNDRYDMVQGWMALQFGRWLDPEGLFGRAALSPVAQDFAGLAPIYLQTGGREILHDMIRDFAEVQAGHGADVMLDVWPTMPHDFQLYDSLEVASTAALERIARAVRWAAGEVPEFGPGAMTARTAGRFFGA